jgi:hypothetical protein
VDIDAWEGAFDTSRRNYQIEKGLKAIAVWILASVLPLSESSF